MTALVRKDRAPRLERLVEVFRAFAAWADEHDDMAQLILFPDASGCIKSDEEEVYGFDNLDEAMTKIEALR